MCAVYEFYNVYRILTYRKVLLLGSGFVAKPTVDVLSAEKDIEVTVGTWYRMSVLNDCIE
jgi:hypothetical protein